MKDFISYDKSFIDIGKHMNRNNYQYNSQCIQFRSPAFHEDEFDRFVFFSHELNNIKNRHFQTKNDEQVLENLAQTENYHVQVPIHWTTSCQ